jgi:hypothetical protein
MHLTAGARLGPYEIVAPLGAGGMGEVYKARDTRLERTVAIKILPAGRADDPQRRERFRREARAISSLTHPHICTLHDIGEQDGVDFLVMEYLAGETLAHRLLRGALPLEDVLRIAVELAEALDAAHRASLTHRDLKPANVMLTPGGAKVLDFGLAKWHGGASDAAISGVQATAHPTLTQVGTVAGTIQYMAPEQVEGKPADARSDIFALGAMVYEMTTGRKAFEGTSSAGVMAAILSSVPAPMATLQPVTPPVLERVVRKCLAKDPARRWQTAADLRDELAWIESDLTVRAAPALAPIDSAEPKPRRGIATAIAVAACLVATGVAFIVGQRAGFRAGPRANGTSPTFRLLTFRRGWIQTARFAPDGQTIVYSAAWDGKPLEIFATRRDSSESRTLGLPSGSIESISSLGDLAIILGCREKPICGDGVLARAPLAGGPPRELLEHVTFADWAPDGRNLAAIHMVDGRSRLEYPIGHVLYEAPPASRLQHVAFSHSGNRIAFTEVAGGGLRTLFVIGLDGHPKPILPPFGFLFADLKWSPNDDELWFARSTPENPTEVYATDVAGKQRLVERIPQAAMLTDIGRDGSLLLKVAAEPRWFRLVGRAPGDSEDRDLSVLSNPVVADLSNDGRTVLFDDIAYGVNRGVRGVFLRRMDGSPAVRLGDGEAVALSPDGKLALSFTLRPKQLVLLPTGPGEARTLPASYEDWRSALWLPDGRRFIMNAREAGHAWRGYLHDVGGGTPRPITPEHIEPLLVSPDGKLVLAAGPDRSRSSALYAIDSIGGGAPRPVHGLDPEDAPVQWCADPGFLFVRAPGMYPARVFRFNLQTGIKTPWKDLAPSDPAGLFWVGRMYDARDLYITRDGSAYAYMYNRVLADLFLVGGLK